MAKAAKKRPGRPRKNPTEKPEQFSIRLPAQSRLILEGFARLKGASLSRAVGFLLTENADRYKVDDIGLLTAIQSLYQARVEELQAVATGDNPIADLKWLDGWRTWLLTSDAGKLLVMPPSLLSQEEHYIMTTLAATWTDLTPAICDRIFADIMTMAALGVAQDEAIRYARNQAPDRIIGDPEKLKESLDKVKSIVEHRDTPRGHVPTKRKK